MQYARANVSHVDNHAYLICIARIKRQYKIYNNAN